METGNLTSERDLKNKVSAAYKMICSDELGNDPDSVQKRVGLVRLLESILKTEFKFTEDFDQKIKNYLEGHKGSPGKRLKRARKATGLLQTELAALLNCDQSFIAKIERGEKTLMEAAIRFIEFAENGYSKAEIFRLLGHTEKSKKSSNSFKINNLQNLGGQK